jgi:hypothetical protein
MTFSAGHFGCSSSAPFTPRNWTLSEEVSRQQINDLWEAVHEIHDLLTRWHHDCESEIRMYLQEYKEKWSEPDLGVAYQDGMGRRG